MDSAARAKPGPHEIFPALESFLAGVRCCGAETGRS